MGCCSKIKIGVLIDSGNMGGIQKIAIEEVKNLNRLGFCANLLVMDMKLQSGEPTQNVEFLFNSKFPKIKVPPFDFLTLNHMFTYVNPIKLKKITKYNVIIAHNILSAIPPIISSKIFNKHIKKVLYFHDTAYTIINLYTKSKSIQQIVRKIENKVINSYDLIVANSDITANIIKEIYGVDPFILYPGVSYISGKPPQRKLYDIVFVTRWNSRRNLELVLEIAKSFPKFKIVMAGIWSNTRDKNEFLIKLIEENVRNIKIIDKFLNERDLLGLYYWSKMYVQTEPVAFGMGALEALANWCIPIVWKESGVSRLFLKEGMGRFIVSSKKDILKKVNEILTEYPIKGMAQLVRNIRKKYNWATHVRKLVKIIYSI